ncbi:hypothetical protein PSHT_13202 [Puccinia striiformis]|uniref:Dynactin subunit 6 n=3 Tax=Puccinia striiformis TaxID=27350 RepID=A0A2S4US71_9BASI|nr:hypothetical protein PSHT_13202 [Puccinia striiformis]POW09958.1 hypothetical protein PSTT_06379 [Puccinia striiformis]
MPKIENIFTFHPTDLALVVDDDAASVVAQDVDLVGEVTIGPNCIVHPSCTIVALGPIIFGSGCIIEEQSVICNRRKSTMRIGNDNLFSVGCRVEATSIGSHNVFEAKCKVSPEISIESYCVIGAGCTVVAEPSLSTFKTMDKIDTMSTPEEQIETYKQSGVEIRNLVDYTVIFGDRSDSTKWSGEGLGQAKALHAKHLLYLSETLPKFHRTRTVVNSSSKPRDSLSSSKTAK